MISLLDSGQGCIHFIDLLNTLPFTIDLRKGHKIKATKKKTGGKKPQICNVFYICVIYIKLVTFITSNNLDFINEVISSS